MISYLYLVLLFVYCSLAASKERNRSACTLVDTKIYCYGGGKSSAAASYVLYDDDMSLDLTASLTLGGQLFNWDKPPSNQNYLLESRWGHAMSALPSSTPGYLVTMGSNYMGASQNSIKNVTAIYFTANQSWTTIDTSFIPRTFAPSTVLDNKNVVWLYGGLIVSASKSSDLDAFYIDQVNTTNVTLPTNIYGFDVTTWTWTAYSIPAEFAVRADHAAAMGNDNKMYIVGGMTVVNGDPYRKYVQMEQILIFDTINHQWQQSITKGPIPKQRRSLSLTYLPHKNQFVMYGGVYDNGSRSQRESMDDVCYTLDLPTLTWTLIDVHLNNPTALGAGQLYGHNAVLYNKDLFIMFGVDEHNDYRSDVNVLDTDTWQWKNSFNSNPFWTAGPIVGLVIGILSFIAIVLLLVYFFRYRKSTDFYDRNKFLPSKRPSDQFVIDTEDPRLNMETEQVYQESAGHDGTVIYDSRGFPTTRLPTSTSFSTVNHDNSYQHQPQHRNSDRTLSTTILGSVGLATGLSARPMSSMSQCVTDSTLTSFSGTTKPDQSDPPLTPTTTVAIQRIKPDGET